MLPIAFHTLYKHSLPEGYTFAMLKYKLLIQQLLLEGIAEKAYFFGPHTW